MSFDTRINRLKRRLNRQDGPIFLTIIGDPEVRKLRHEGRLSPFSMASPRHAMIGRIITRRRPTRASKPFMRG